MLIFITSSRRANKQTVPPLPRPGGIVREIKIQTPIIPMRRDADPVVAAMSCQSTELSMLEVEATRRRRSSRYRVPAGRGSSGVLRLRSVFEWSRVIEATYSP